MSKKLLFLALMFINIGYTFAVNEISIRKDISEDRTKPGYISSATLSIEPQGGYVSEALYVEYTDRAVYSGSNVEIIHRFNLPRGAVVRDLWLWIGDSVMQAQIKDTWTARHIYDSITSFKRDPAFLNVTDGQYELRIYPLESGKVRKIKMECLVPVSFFGEQAQVDLPYSFLSADNSTKTPLRVLFRYDSRLEYGFKILEAGTLEYKQIQDTLGMHYYESNISDIKELPGLTVTYKESFPNGFSCSREAIKSGSVYSVGISPGKIFNSDSSKQCSKRLCVGIDLNGNYGTLGIDAISKGFSALQNELSDGDSIKFVISGEGLIDTFPDAGFMSAVEVKETLGKMLDGSKVVSKIKSKPKLRILFCDPSGKDFMFPGLESLAQCSIATDLMSVLPVLSKFDIAAAYRYGYEDELNDNDAEIARTHILEYMKAGGYFLSYLDYNRRNEKIALQLIENLQVPTGFKASTLTRTPNGYISDGFPNSIYFYTSCPLKYTDSKVIPEMVNTDNEPVVISKQFGSGYLVVNGMWPGHIDAGLKQQLHTALLGLNRAGKNSQINELFQTVCAINNDLHFTNVIVMSNADALVTSDNLVNKLSEINQSNFKQLPQTHCISLLDGTIYLPPIYTEKNVNYYGSGYLLSKIAEQTNGLYFGIHEYDWKTIYGSILNAASVPVNNISCKMKCNGVDIAQETVMQPNMLNQKLNSSRFYTVQCKDCEVIEAEIAGIKADNDSAVKKTVTIETRDILNRERSFLSAEHANDIMLKMLQSVPLDTQAIVKFALEHRLMNDFTAFIALEPNDSLFFMQNPYDESKYKTNVSVNKAVLKQFAVRVLKKLKKISLVLNIPHNGTIQVRLFTIDGRLVYRHDVSCGAGSMNITLANRQLGKGVYIAVVKYRSYGIISNSVQTRIEKFTME